MKDYEINKCIGFINDEFITNALGCLGDEATRLGMRNTAEEASQLLTELKYMLKYFAKGANDPSRSEMLAKIYDKAYRIATEIDVKKRKLTCNSGALSAIDPNNAQELFDGIIGNFPPTADDRAFLQRTILDDHLPIYLRGMAVAALTINLINYFDNEKFESLYTYTLDDQPIEVRARAWVGIVLVAMIHDKRIMKQPRLVEQLKFICEEDSTNEEKALIKVQIALIQSLETKKARDLYLNEITPSIEKNFLNIKKDAKSEPKEEIELDFSNDKELDNLQDSIIDFIEMQNQGIDIFFESFYQVKNTPFFRKSANWLMPFSCEHPDVAKLLSKNEIAKKFVKFISKSNRMSSTDKYSNLSFLELVSGANAEMMTNALTSTDGENEQPSQAPTLGSEIISYVHDLFRYYKIFLKKQDDKIDPFEKSMYFGRYATLEHAVATYELKYEIANLLFKNKNYREAITVQKELVTLKRNKENQMKLAYSMLKDDSENLQLIDILSALYIQWPDDTWIIRNHAKELIMITNYSAAEQVLLKAMEQYPDDVTFIHLIAKSYMKQDRYSDAMHYLYKADVIRENDTTTLKLMAECALYMGDKESAEQNIARVLKGKPNDDHWILGGHIALLDNNIPLALKRYGEVDIYKMLEYIRSRFSDLHKAGIPQETITLIHEVMLNPEL